MKVILAAALFLAAPAFAHGDDYDDYGYDTDAAPPPPPADGPSVSQFQYDDDLRWNGEWIQTAEYGLVWRPTNISSSWQPYVYGRWVYTDAGWAWFSDEPFGWAVYHYGEWGYSSALGWYWIPGTVWAPAWVSWRWNDGYAGWCPLGPAEQPRPWVFVPTRQFLEPVRHNAVPRPVGAALPPPQGGGPHAGPAVTVVERATGRLVRPVAAGQAATAVRPMPPQAMYYGATLPHSHIQPGTVRPQMQPLGVRPIGSPAPLARPQVVAPALLPHIAPAQSHAAPAAAGAARPSSAEQPRARER